MSKTTNPFVPRPFTPTPFRGGSPLAGNARQFAPRITIESAEEQTRAEGIPAAMRAGELEPTFRPVATPAPYTSTTPIPTNPEPEAGPKSK